MRNARLAWIVAAAVATAVATTAGGCASGGGTGGDDAARTEPAEVVVTVPLAAGPNAAPPQWEPWPPAGAVNIARAPATGPIVELTCPPGGMKTLDLLRLLQEKTGAVVLYDTLTNQKLKTTDVEWFGTWRVPTSRLVDAVRAVLHHENLLLVPIGLGGEGEAYFVQDQNNPVIKGRPVWLPETEVLAHEECDGLYVVTTLRVRDMVDTSRVRQALTSMTTMSASIGRIQDVPGGRTILIGDFAPVVAAMKRVVDEINARAVPPVAAVVAQPVAPK